MAQRQGVLGGGPRVQGWGTESGFGVSLWSLNLSPLTLSEVPELREHLSSCPKVTTVLFRGARGRWAVAVASEGTLLQDCQCHSLS